MSRHGTHYQLLRENALQHMAQTMADTSKSPAQKELFLMDMALHICTWDQHKPETYDLFNQPNEQQADLYDLCVTYFKMTLQEGSATRSGGLHVMEAVNFKDKNTSVLYSADQMKEHYGKTFPKLKQFTKAIKDLCPEAMIENKYAEKCIKEEAKHITKAQPKAQKIRLHPSRKQINKAMKMDPYSEWLCQ